MLMLKAGLFSRPLIFFSPPDLNSFETDKIQMGHGFRILPQQSFSPEKQRFAKPVRKWVSLQVPPSFPHIERERETPT